MPLSRSEQLMRNRSMGSSVEPFDPNQFAGYGPEIHPDNSASKASLIGDGLMGFVRGAEGLVQGVYGLADTVLGDALPDYEDRLFGHSKTGIGSFIESGSQFLYGFIPVMGWVGRGASVAGKFSLAKGLSTTAQASAKVAGKRGLKGLSPLSQATHIELRRAGISGAIVDFAGFSGTEARLSNLIQESDVLSNEVTAFLAADEDDGELFGRMKNVFEGYVLGLVADGLIEGAKGSYKMFAKKQAEDLADGVALTKKMQTAQRNGASEDELAGIARAAWNFSPSASAPRDALSPDLVQMFQSSSRKAVGAPPRAISSIRSVRNVVDHWTDGGVGGDDWYKTGSRLMLDLTGDNVDEAGELVQVMSLLASSSGPARDSSAGLRAWSDFKEGMTKEEFLKVERDLPEDAVEKVARVLYDGADFHAIGDTSRKIYNSFMAEMDPSKVRGDEYDVWLTKAFGFTSEKLTGSQYEFIGQAAVRAGEVLGRTASQVQAAVWTYAKDFGGRLGDEVLTSREFRRRMKQDLDLSNIPAGSEDIGEVLAMVRAVEAQTAKAFPAHVAAPSKVWDRTGIKQAYSSTPTSINKTKMPEVFKRIDNSYGWESGSVNVDIGGGRFDNGTAFLKERGVVSHVYDPFNRTAAHNGASVDRVGGGQADTATISNVLDLIKDPKSRKRVLQQAEDALKPGGRVFIQVYDGSGEALFNQAAVRQNGRKLKAYLEEVQAVFDVVDMRDGVLVGVRKGDPLQNVNRLSVGEQMEYSASLAQGKVRGDADAVKNSWRHKLTLDPHYLPESSAPLKFSVTDIYGTSMRTEGGQSLRPAAGGDPNIYEGYVVSRTPAHSGAVSPDSKFVTDLQDVAIIADQPGIHIVPVMLHADDLKITGHTPTGVSGVIEGRRPGRLRDLTREEMGTVHGSFIRYSGQGSAGVESLVEVLRGMDLAVIDERTIVGAIRDFDGALRQANRPSPFDRTRFFGADMGKGLAGAQVHVGNLIAISARIGKQDPKGMLRTIYHEMFHSLESYLSKDQAQAVFDAYKREKAAVTVVGDRGGLPDNFNQAENSYRYSSATEWFAESMADRSLVWRLKEAGFPDNEGVTGWLDSIIDMVVRVASTLNPFRKMSDTDFMDGLFKDFIEGRQVGSKQPRSSGWFMMNQADGALNHMLAGGEPRAVIPLRKALMQTLVGEDNAKSVIDAIDKRAGENWPSGINPRAKTEKGDYVYSLSQLLEFQLQRSDLNLDRFNAGEDALGTIRAVEGLFREYGPAKVTFGEQEEQALEQLADMMGGAHPDRTKAELLVDIAADADAARTLNSRVLARKMLLLKHSKKVKDLAENARKVSASDQDLLEFREAVDYHAKLTLGVKALASEQGRGLGSGNINIRDIEVDPRKARDIVREGLDRAGGPDKLRDLADQVHSGLEGGDMTPGAVGTLSRLAKGVQQKPSMLLEYWINAILSGPQTQLVNIIANTMTTIYLPLEKMLGAAIRMDLDVVAQGWRELVSLQSSFRDALRFSRMSLKESRSVISPDLGKLDDPRMTRQAITGDHAADKLPWLNDHEEIKGLIDVAGGVARVPTRLLTSADEFFKQWNFRAKIRADLLGRANKEGLRGADVGRFVQGEMDKFFFQGQAYSAASEYRRGVEDAHVRGVPTEGVDAHAKQFARDSYDPERMAQGEAAMNRAQEATFTKPLRPGSLSAKMQQAVASHPLLRLVMPFIRTPVNIATFAGQRMDVSSLGPVAKTLMNRKGFSKASPAIRDAQQRLIQDVVSGDPERRSEALGRMAMGFGLSFSMMQLAMDGKVTGRGPSDPEMRRIMMDGGWQPYSILVDGKYISYSRLDPLASMIGVPADLVGYSQWSTQADQGPLEEMFFGTVYAFSSNFISKTYLTGVRNLVDMLYEPERKVRPELQRLGASFLPFSSFANQLNQADDRALREVRTLGEAMRAKIPGMSDDLSPMRNILGEPVHRAGRLGMETLGSPALFFSPIAVSEVSSDLLHKEFVKLGHPFNPPYPRKEGVDLREVKNTKGVRAYDRWMELHGQVSLQGTTLKQALRRVIRSSSYQKLNPDSTFEIDSPRIGVLQRVLGQYRHAAYRKMLSEYPELQQQHAHLNRKRRDLFLR